MTFYEAENYLYSLGNEVETMKLGLENISTLLAALGTPQNSYAKVQIAGTNGKGSVCAFLNEICLSAGIRTGLFTSPHLVSVTERIKIGGVEVTKEDFARYATRVREVSEALVHTGKLERVPTFFEQVTAVALLAFAEEKVQLAILETGLGGRYDATTAARAEIAVLTRIDLDHQEYLGDTIEEVAEEKAAIIREDSSGVVIGAQEPAAMDVINARCASLGIRPSNETYQLWRVVERDAGTVSVNLTRQNVEGVRLGLKGRHQIENAETAINTVQSLKFDLGITIAEEDVLEGLENASHPGRLEVIDRFLFDGAHNPGGMKMLRQYLEDAKLVPATIVFGAMRDKPVKEMLGLILPMAQSLILTVPANSRAASLEELTSALPARLEQVNVVAAGSVAEALRYAKDQQDAGMIVVTGSLYLVGEVKKLLAAGDI